jgi:DNA repair exonuclease SbcCD ATPase subunit
MKRGWTVLLAGFLIFLVSFVWAADSKLVEAAKREKERRAKINSEKVKTITNQDIEDFKKRTKTAGGDDSEASTPGDETTTPPAYDTGTAPPDRTSVEAEEAWRKRYENASKKLDDAKTKLSDLQSQFNAANNAYYNNSQAGNMALWDQMDALNKEIQNAQADVNNAEQGVDNLQNEARQEGIPPGWVEDRN